MDCDLVTGQENGEVLQTRAILRRASPWPLPGRQGYMNRRENMKDQDEYECHIDQFIRQSVRTVY